LVKKIATLLFKFSRAHAMAQRQDLRPYSKSKLKLNSEYIELG